MMPFGRVSVVFQPGAAHRRVAGQVQASGRIEPALEPKWIRPPITQVAPGLTPSLTDSEAAPVRTV